MPRGPLPKPEHARRRRTPPVHDWTELPDPYSGPIPTLPSGGDWTTHTRRWWNRIWRTRAASMWTPEDRPALEELALLRQAFWQGGHQALAGEIRLRSDALGLTPRGRQQLRWRVTELEPEPTRAPMARDPRSRRLRAVDPDDALMEIERAERRKRLEDFNALAVDPPPNGSGPA